MTDVTTDALTEIKAFLPCETPDAWIVTALEHQDILLIDHANCEKKAASTAMNLMYKYIDRPELLKKMSQLAREELLHFEQVVGILQDRQVEYRFISPARYAKGLREKVRNDDEGHLVDILIVGAIIEARSCERFAKLAPHLDSELGKYYQSLLRSEGRHYQDYLSLAKLYSSVPIEERIQTFCATEKILIESPDSDFRFHSGVPV
jgi:tRNA-(ms[2]io[6]A)-hydroxylase